MFIAPIYSSKTSVSSTSLPNLLLPVHSTSSEKQQRRLTNYCKCKLLSNITNTWQHYVYRVGLLHMINWSCSSFIPYVASVM